MKANYFWQGDLVQLRQFREEDTPRKLEEYYDSQARRLLQDGITDLPPVSFEKYNKATGRDQIQMDDNDFNKNLMLAIENADKEFVGWINMWRRDPRSGVFECGFSIFKDFRRRGYAADALKIFLRYGFYELRMQKCNAACFADNTASVKLHKGLGFKEEGCRRREIYTDNQYHDLLLFGLLKEEFEAL